VLKGSLLGIGNYLGGATIALLVLKGSLLGIGNYLGGSLILKDKIGVET
jgi:hypothetical protein